jgi:hypothetical protein
VPNQTLSVFDGFSCSHLDGLDALLQSLDGGHNVNDACTFHWLNVISVQVVTDLADNRQ